MNSLTPPPPLSKERRIRLDDCEEIAITGGEDIRVTGAKRVIVAHSLQVVLVDCTDVQLSGVADLRIHNSLISKWGNGNIIREPSTT